MEWRFPVEDYPESVWGTYCTRIEAGAKGERKQLKDRFEAWGGGDYAEDMAADANALRAEVSATMYAALVVSIWAEIEGFINSALSAVADALGERPARSHIFKMLSSEFVRHTGSSLSSLPSFGTINTIRVANNCFKHSGGRYDHPTKPAEQLDQQLISRWRLLRSNGRHDFIQFQNIPIEEAIRGCNHFLEALLAECLAAAQRAQSNAGGGP